MKLKKLKCQKVVAEIFGTSSANISMYFSNIIQEDKLDEKEVSISSKDLFKDESDFIKKSLKKSNNRGRPHLITTKMQTSQKNSLLQYKTN